MQCVGGADNGTLPGWQWRPGDLLDPEEELRPWNSSIPPCGNYLALLFISYILFSKLLAPFGVVLCVKWDGGVNLTEWDQYYSQIDMTFTSKSNLFNI